MEPIRLILFYACSKRIKMYHMDVKSSFMKGELEEQVDIEHPKGFILSKKEDYVCKLKKELYRLKEAPEHGIQYWTVIYSNNDSRKVMQTTIST
jgi:hypothetical protein